PKNKDIVMPAFVLSGTLEEIDDELPKQLFEKSPEAVKTIKQIDYVSQLKEVEKANTQTSTPSSRTASSKPAPVKKDPNREKADKFATMAGDFLTKKDYFQAKGYYKEALKLFPGDVKYKEGLLAAEKAEKDSTDLFAQFATPVETKTFVPVNINVEETADADTGDGNEDPDSPLGDDTEADEVESIKDSINQ
ncbi:MAG TPA: hypothetical protein PKK33_11030, partial [Candidatus Cloacimonadota bacterium]|nr:hypothetical protein [Candidatus Cloacimonadota bacterium]